MALISQAVKGTAEDIKVVTLAKARTVGPPPQWTLGVATHGAKVPGKVVGMLGRAAGRRVVRILGKVAAMLGIAATGMLGVLAKAMLGIVAKAKEMLGAMVGKIQRPVVGTVGKVVEKIPGKAMGKAIGKEEEKIWAKAKDPKCLGTTRKDCMLATCLLI